MPLTLKQKLERAVLLSLVLQPARYSLLFFALLLFSAGLVVGASTPAGEKKPKAPKELRRWLDSPGADRKELAQLSLAKKDLSKKDADAVLSALWENHARMIRETRLPEMTNKVVEMDGKKMKFDWLSFTNAPATNGRSLFISMHGGGGAPPRVNDQQWRNQIQLGTGYNPAEGIYVAPRAPGDSWDLWHQGHIDGFFARLIENFVVFENINPNRVYLMGYSAGGDGVYQLAPRMADRLAAASMMAGHPNEASPLGLRNLPFAIQVGGNDSAYNRNKVAAEWGKKLDELQAVDPMGYSHFTEIHEGKPHWMGMQDKKAVPWMEKFTRNPLPDKIVWYQDDVVHTRFYWLARPQNEVKGGQEIRAEKKGQTFEVKGPQDNQLILLLNDRLVDLDKPITVVSEGRTLFTGKVKRNLLILERTLREYGDTNLTFSAEVVVRL